MIVLAAVLVICGSSAIVWAGEKQSDVEKTTWGSIISDVVGHYPLPQEEYVNGSPGTKTKLSQPKNWLFDITMRRYIESHTSYQFGNPDAPHQKPLSRLEWPLNTWWLDMELRRTCPRWSAGGRASFNVARDVVGRMQDTDWENPENTSMMTTYSESYARMRQNYSFRGDVDVNISDWLGLPAGFEIRPLFAFLYQHFTLYDYDGTQWSVGNYGHDNQSFGIDGETDVTELPDVWISFKQDYYMYMIGLRGSCDVLKPTRDIKIRARGEADWGPAVGYNEDHHLRREGNMFIREKTAGNALYFMLGVDMVFWNTLTVGFTMDYLWIRTLGIHKWINEPLGVNQCWSDGVKVWSDQTSLMMHASYAF